jgi:hypothetical protein
MIELNDEPIKIEENIEISNTLVLKNVLLRYCNISYSLSDFGNNYIKN